MSENFYYKAIRKIRQIFVQNMRGSKLYYFMYFSYLHSLIFKNLNYENCGTLYFCAQPRPGAGIGHQLANWIAGYWFAKMFKLKFAHIPFPNNLWENFLGFGNEEIKVVELKKIGYRIKRIPLFDEKNYSEIRKIKKIISSYANRKVIFLSEQDQFYFNQYEVSEVLKKKFYSSPYRLNERILYKENYYNIAIHIRRGDIINGEIIKKEKYKKRWLSNLYYINVLTSVLDCTPNAKPVKIFLFSQGNLNDFKEFHRFGNIEFFLNMDEHDSFLHLVKADMLITSKSSFSYKPALLSNGIKLCPANFWHGYPRTNDFILVDDNGYFDPQFLNFLKEK